MAKTEFENNYAELDEYDLEEMAKQIKTGCSSGHLHNGKVKNIYWELNVNVWKD